MLINSTFRNWSRILVYLWQQKLDNCPDWLNWTHRSRLYCSAIIANIDHASCQFPACRLSDNVRRPASQPDDWWVRPTRSFAVAAVNSRWLLTEKGIIRIWESPTGSCCTAVNAATTIRLRMQMSIALKPNSYVGVYETSLSIPAFSVNPIFCPQDILSDI